jgi:hypothetical protein
MADNWLSQHAAAIGDVLLRTVPPGVGFVVILTDDRTGDYAQTNNVHSDVHPMHLLLRAVANAEELKYRPRLINPDMFDPTGGVLPRGGVRTLPSGKKLSGEVIGIKLDAEPTQK